MPLLMQTLDGINRKIQKRTKGRFQTTPALQKLVRENGIDDSEELIRFMNQFDPTDEQAKYTQWILKSAAEGRFRLPEDGNRVKTTLTIFHNIKKSGRVQINKDINAYKNFREFEKLMSQYKGEGEDLGQSVKQWEKWIKTQGYDLVYRDEKFTLLKFEQTGDKIEVFPASIGKYESKWIPTKFRTDKDTSPSITVDKTALAVSILSCGTSYCVADPRTAETYLKSGPLYAFFKDGKFSFLAEPHLHEFANTDDSMIKTASTQLGFFLTKVLLKVPEKVVDIDAFQRRIAQVLEARGDTIPPKVKKYMYQALAIGSSDAR